MINRRDFLKFSGLLSASYLTPKMFSLAGNNFQNSVGQNIMIVVFDAFSASNISLYGYGRNTTPNIDRAAENAIVYHNHISASNFTTPGTASLLTGTLPWTHRAFTLNEGVDKSLTQRNIFRVFRDYYSLAYSHNPYAHKFLNQFRADIDNLTLRKRLYLEGNAVVDKFFSEDEDIASVSWQRGMELGKYGYAYSLFLSHLSELLNEATAGVIENDFPLGMPNWNERAYFVLEQAIDWLMKQMTAAPEPFLGYYHFYPPHAPYNTRKEFHNKFANDGYHPVDKPRHIFEGPLNNNEILAQRKDYDEFILYIDSEFGRLYDFMEESGMLENTWLILTSDHGELFERGIVRHTTHVLYQPVIQVPFLIFKPGQKKRMDIYERTSLLDLLPTLAYLTDHEIPDWAEGNVMPPFSDSLSNTEGDTLSMRVEDVNRKGVIKSGSISLLRDNYKLMYFFGLDDELEDGELIELYDLKNDPEELINLYPERKDIADELMGTVKAKLDEVNQNYQ